MRGIDTVPCILCVPCGSIIRAGVVLDVQYRDAGDDDEEKCKKCCGEHCAFTAALKDELGEDARRADAAENADDAEGSGGAAEAGDFEHRYRGEQVEPAPGAKIVEAIFGVIEADEKITMCRALS